MVRSFHAYWAQFQTNTGQGEGNGQVQCMQRFLYTENVPTMLTLVPNLTLELK